jgi:hypothetical protein
MAQRIGPAGSVRVSVTGSHGGQNIVNVFWTRLTISGVVTQADLDTYTTNFGAAYKTNFQPQLPSGFTFGTVKSVYFVDGSALNVLESTQAMTGVGTGTASADRGLAGVISWLSAAYWRGGKPRTYLEAGTGSIDPANPSSWTSTYITALGAAAAAFRTAVNGLTGGTTITGSALGFVSFFSNNALRSPAVFFAISGTKIHPRIGHQRRRDGRWRV